MTEREQMILELNAIYKTFLIKEKLDQIHPVPPTKDESPIRLIVGGKELLVTRSEKILPSFQNIIYQEEYEKGTKRLEDLSAKRNALIRHKNNLSIPSEPKEKTVTKNIPPKRHFFYYMPRFGVPASAIVLIICLLLFFLVKPSEPLNIILITLASTSFLPGVFLTTLVGFALFRTVRLIKGELNYKKQLKIEKRKYLTSCEKYDENKKAIEKEIEETNEKNR